MISEEHQPPFGDEFVAGHLHFVPAHGAFDPVVEKIADEPDVERRRALRLLVPAVDDRLDGALQVLVHGRASVRPAFATSVALASSPAALLAPAGLDDVIEHVLQGATVRALLGRRIVVEVRDGAAATDRLGQH